MKAKISRTFCISGAMLLSSILSQAQQSLQIVPNHLRPAVARGQSKPLRAMEGTQRLNLSIVLPLRNEAQLTSLLSRIYDPSSPDYHRFLSVGEFTQQFAPSSQDYQSVVDLAKANGFTVTGLPANRLIVPVNGTVEQIQKAFNVSMKVYQHPTENRTFFSPDREPSVSTKVTIAHIAGLNNFSIPRPMAVKGPVALSVSNSAVLGSGPGGSYLGSDMRSAYYGGSVLTGTGQTVGLFQLDGYNMSDVNLTFSNSGQVNHVPINNVLLDGATGKPGQFTNPADDSEQVLDIVQAIGMAPGLDQVRVYIGNLDADIFNAMAAENIARQLSVSWTWSPDDPGVDDVFFKEFAAQGQSLFVASGDWGGFDPSTPYFYPAEDGWATAVGGTNLVTKIPGAPGSRKRPGAGVAAV